MAVWPGSLPQYFEIGVTDNRQSGFLRTPVDAGPPKVRKRFSAISRIIQGTMLFTEAQRDTFETFYSTTIDEGSLAFDFLDPDDFSTQSFAFVEPPSLVGLVGGATGTALWRFSLTLERLP